MLLKTCTPSRPYGGIEAGKRSQTRRDAFIEAGLESFGTIGYARSTIKGICEIAGLTQRYLYESFKNKEELLVAVFHKLMADIESEARVIADQSGLSAEEMALRGLRMFFQRFKDDPRRARVQLFEVLGVSPRMDREYRSAIIALAEWIKMFLLMAFPGLEEKWRATDVIHTGIAGAIIQISSQWVLEGMETPIDVIAGQVTEAFRVLGRYYNDRKEFCAQNSKKLHPAPLDYPQTET